MTASRLQLSKITSGRLFFIMRIVVDAALFYKVAPALPLIIYLQKRSNCFCTLRNLDRLFDPL
jgi:hypothetical protein